MFLKTHSLGFALLNAEVSAKNDRELRLTLICKKMLIYHVDWQNYTGFEIVFFGRPTFLLSFPVLELTDVGVSCM